MAEKFIRVTEEEEKAMAAIVEVAEEDMPYIGEIKIVKAFLKRLAALKPLKK